MTPLRRFRTRAAASLGLGVATALALGSPTQAQLRDEPQVYHPPTLDDCWRAPPPGMNTQQCLAEKNRQDNMRGRPRNEEELRQMMEQQPRR